MPTLQEKEQQSHHPKLSSRPSFFVVSRSPDKQRCGKKALGRQRKLLMAYCVLDRVGDGWQHAPRPGWRGSGQAIHGVLSWCRICCKTYKLLFRSRFAAVNLKINCAHGVLKTSKSKYIAPKSISDPIKKFMTHFERRVQPQVQSHRRSQKGHYGPPRWPLPFP